MICPKCNNTNVTSTASTCAGCGHLFKATSTTTRTSHSRSSTGNTDASKSTSQTKTTRRSPPRRSSATSHKRNQTSTRSRRSSTNTNPSTTAYQPTSTSVNTAPPQQSDFVDTIASMFGYSIISGKVISTEQPYTMPPPMLPIGLIFKAILGLLLLPLLIIISMVNGLGIYSGIFTEILNAVTLHNMAKEKREVNVREVRLRDQAGEEYLVRIEGGLVAGNFMVGDDVDVTGVNKGGTLLLLGGFNNRARTRIEVQLR